ncbi:hypothetical protein FH972_026379 [Carpinus fangiana]|uniref:Dystroglycan-type cadherin-like domain-containing protein n=1 Tax=Carpinus fangiana TaxID=176857 RepID=A0A5N6L3X4_9ROSI|nr:hypothetical protein FH972_026379 [Carpinus fangiana]
MGRAAQHETLLASTSAEVPPSSVTDVGMCARMTTLESLPCANRAPDYWVAQSESWCLVAALRRRLSRSHTRSIPCAFHAFARPLEATARLRMNLFTATIAILSTAAYSAPEVAFPINNQVPPVARVSEAYIYEFAPNTYSAVDSNALVYTIQRAPAWLSLDGRTRTFSGTPAASDIGSFAFQLEATDEFGIAHLQVTLVVVDDKAPTVIGNISKALAMTGPLSEPTTLALGPGIPFEIHIGSDMFQGGEGKLWLYPTSDNRSPLPSWVAFDVAKASFVGVTPQPATAPRNYGLSLYASTVPGFAEAGVDFAISVVNHKLIFDTVDLDLSLAATVPVSIDLKKLLTLDGQAVSADDVASAGVKGPDWLSWGASDGPLGFHQSRSLRNEEDGVSRAVSHPLRSHPDTTSGVSPGGDAALETPPSHLTIPTKAPSLLDRRDPTLSRTDNESAAGRRLLGAGHGRAPASSTGLTDELSSLPRYSSTSSCYGCESDDGTTQRDLRRGSLAWRAARRSALVSQRLSTIRKVESTSSGELVERPFSEKRQSFIHRRASNPNRPLFSAGPVAWRGQSAVLPQRQSQQLSGKGEIPLSFSAEPDRQGGVFSAGFPKAASERSLDSAWEDADSDSRFTFDADHGSVLIAEHVDNYEAASVEPRIRADDEQMPAQRSLVRVPPLRIRKHAQVSSPCVEHRTAAGQEEGRRAVRDMPEADDVMAFL